MSEEQPKTAANPKTDIQARSHHEIPSSSEFQPDISPEDGKPKPATQAETNTPDPGNMRQGKVDIPNQSVNEATQLCESRQDKPKPSTENANSDASNRLLDGLQMGFLMSNPGCIEFGVLSGSPNSDERRDGCKEGLAVAGHQAKLTIVEEATKPNIQFQTDTNVGSKMSADHPWRPREGNAENSEAFRAEGNLSPPFTTDKSGSNVQIPVDSERLSRSRGHKTSCHRNGELNVNGDHKNPERNKPEHANISEIGHEQVLLPPPPAHRKGRSNTQPRGVPGSKRGGRSMDVRYSKTAGVNQPSDPSSGRRFESRDIFENGGEESLNPRSNSLRGILHAGGDEIENLKEESPEPRVVITPTTPLAEPEMTESWTSFDLKENPFSCKWLAGKIEQQLAKAPLFYLISLLMIILSGIVLAGGGEDSDIVIGIIATVVCCIFVTLAVPRGHWAQSVDKLEERGFLSLFQRDPKQPGLCSACCRRRKSKVVRHSKYYHLEEDTDTTFEHEIADLSKINPEDYPQIRTVDERETTESGSPDSPPDLSRLNVDIHAPSTSRNPEELGAISKHRRQTVSTKKSTKPHPKTKSTKSSSAPLKLPPRLKVDVHPARSVDGPEGAHSGVRGADATTRKYPEASDIAAALSSLKARLETLEACDTDIAHDREEFICEHYGQGLACSCSSDVPGKR